MKKPFELVAVVLFSGLALATIGARPSQGPQGRPHPPSFLNIDKNSDGKISREEWQGPPELFDRIDTNADGFISQDEFNSAPRGPGGPGGPGGPRFEDQIIRSLDSDGDGKVSQSEFGQLTQKFDTLDQNKDGFLTPEELGGVFRPSDSTGQHRPPPPGPAGRPGPPTFAALDADANKLISREEWKGPADLFDRVDTNHDGAIDQTEFASLPKGPPHGGPGGGPGGRLLSVLDTDSDQKVSRTEFAALAQLFNSLDTDHDGFLTKEEIGQLFKR